MEFKEQLNQQTLQLEKQICSLKKLQQLVNLYPDLHETKDRWNNSYYVATLVNTSVNRIEIKHACGCCDDAPLLAFFYKEVDGVRIYAKPYSIGIGEKNAWGYGSVPDSNWKETLRKYGIPVEMDTHIQSYFDMHRPKSYDFDDAE